MKELENDILISKVLGIIMNIGILFVILLVQIMLVKYIWDAETKANKAESADRALDSAQAYIKALEDYVDEHGGLFDTVAAGDEYSDYKDALASYNQLQAQ